MAAKNARKTASYVGGNALLGPLDIATKTGAAGVAGSSAVLNKRSGSTLSLVSTLGGKFSIAGSTLSWTTGNTAGPATVQIVETLVGARNSPRTTAVTVTFA